MSVAVLGAGAFGTALAIALAETGTVTLWARSPEHCAEMARDRQNMRRLPGCMFPEKLVASTELETVLQADVLLLAVPMQQLAVLTDQIDLSGKTVVACCKGIDLTTQTGPSAVLHHARHAAILTGPSFATDIAKGLPTALTLACADNDVGKALQSQLSTPVLRLYRSTDVVGAEVGGALKNVLAIGCGAVMGAGLGTSARAALMTRGFAEIQAFATQLGARPETLMGLSGFGDLALTCTSDTSRNYRLGLALGQGRAFDPDTTVEGAATAQALRPQAEALDLPICLAVADLVAGRIDVPEAMARLLARPLKEE